MGCVGYMCAQTRRADAGEQEENLPKVRTERCADGASRTSPTLLIVPCDGRLIFVRKFLTAVTEGEPVPDKFSDGKKHGKTEKNRSLLRSLSHYTATFPAFPTFSVFADFYM